MKNLQIFVIVLVAGGMALNLFTIPQDLNSAETSLANAFGAVGALMFIFGIAVFLGACNVLVSETVKYDASAVLLISVALLWAFAMALFIESIDCIKEAYYAKIFAADMLAKWFVEGCSWTKFLGLSVITIIIDIIIILGRKK